MNIHKSKQFGDLGMLLRYVKIFQFFVFLTMLVEHFNAKMIMEILSRKNVEICFLRLDKCVFIRERL